jgi:hypothetical protein
MGGRLRIGGLRCGWRGRFESHVISYGAYYPRLRAGVNMRRPLLATRRFCRRRRTRRGN